MKRKRVNQSKEQHQLAITLLDRLGLQYIRLKPRKGGSFEYVAWSAPLVDGNGSPRVSRRGVVRFASATNP
jgi:hypothetical protein